QPFRQAGSSRALETALGFEKSLQSSLIMVNSIELHRRTSDRLGVVATAIAGACPRAIERGGRFQHTSFEGECEDAVNDLLGSYHGVRIDERSCKRFGGEYIRRGQNNASSRVVGGYGYIGAAAQVQGAKRPVGAWHSAWRIGIPEPCQFKSHAAGVEPGQRIAGIVGDDRQRTVLSQVVGNIHS